MVLSGTDDLGLLDVDLASAAGADLLERLRERHGPRMAAATSLAKRLFLLRSGDAPGLRFVGGLAEAMPLAGVAREPAAFSLSGVGESIEDALAACVGEGAERLSQLERDGDVARVATLHEVAAQILPSVADQVAAQLGASPDAPARKIDWVAAISLASGEATLVPADWCLRRAADGALRIPGQPLSLGAAAGPDMLAAARAAVLELLERDAVALWWDGGRRGRPLAADGVAMREAADLLGRLRRGSVRRASWLLDITSDLGVPAVAALSTDGAGRNLACGFAARLRRSEAACKAVLEMCQMEFGLQLAAAKAAQLGEAALDDAERRVIARNRIIDARACELLHPIGAPPTDDGGIAPATGDTSRDLEVLSGVLKRHSIDVALVTLSRPELGLAAVAAIAPALQGSPSGLMTKRLQAEVVKSGGGGRWNCGAPLF